MNRRGKPRGANALGVVLIGLVLLVGGDANLFGIETYLSSVLKLPVRMADPFVWFRERHPDLVPPIAKNVSLSYSTVLGLALRGIRIGETETA